MEMKNEKKSLPGVKTHCDFGDLHDDLGIVEMENRVNELRLLANAAETIRDDITGGDAYDFYRGFSAETWSEQYCLPFVKTVHWRLLCTCEFLESVVEKLLQAGKAGIIDLTREEKLELDRKGSELKEEEEKEGGWIEVTSSLREEALELLSRSREEELVSILIFGDVLEKHWQEATDFIFSFDDLDNGPKEEVKRPAPEAADVA